MASLTLLTRNCVCTRPEPSAVVRGVILICAQQTIRGRVSRLLSPIIVVVVVALFVLAALATLTALAALVTLATLVAVVGIGFTSLFAAILAIIVVVFASFSRGARVPIAVAVAVAGLVVVLGRGTFGDIRTLVVINLRASALTAVILWNSGAVILIGRTPIIRPIVARLSVCVTLKAIVNDVTHAPDDVLKLSRRE